MVKKCNSRRTKTRSVLTSTSMKKSTPIIGVIGAAMADEQLYARAKKVGSLIAQKGWTLINGGMYGVMEASAKGASEQGGIVIGILPTHSKRDANEYITYPIVTNIGEARNVIIARTADALIAVGGREGTLSEIAYALKFEKPVASLGSWDIPGVHNVNSPEEGVKWLEISL
jgi:uncharacterized protein (TIGR00725 family)